MNISFGQEKHVFLWLAKHEGIQEKSSQESRLSTLQYQTNTKYKVASKMDSMDDLELASMLERFDKRAHKSNLHCSDEDDEKIFESQYNTSHNVQQIIDIKHGDQGNFVLVYLDDFHLDGKSIRRLGYILSQNTALKHLSISRHFSAKIIGDGMFICAGIRFNRSITKLSLHSVYMHDIPMRILGDFLAENNNLKQISFDKCYLKGDDVDYLSTKVKDRSVSSLKELDLASNSIQENNLDTLVSAMKKCTSIKRLDLSNNGLRGDAITSLVQLLHCDGSGVEVLNLRENSISDDEGLLLIDALKSNNTLKTLDLCDNKSITDDGWASISKAIFQLVFNQESISSIVNSNHCLSSVSCEYDPNSTEYVNGIAQRKDLGIPFEKYLGDGGDSLLRSVLSLNRYQSNVTVIKKTKLIWHHIIGDFVGDDSIGIGLMPRIIALFSYHPRMSLQTAFEEKEVSLLWSKKEEDDDNNNNSEANEGEDLVEDNEEEGAPRRVSMTVYNSGWEDDSSDEEEDEPRHRSSRSTTQNTLRLSSIYQIIKTRPELCAESKSDTQKLVDMKNDYKRLHLQIKHQEDENERLRLALKNVMMCMCFVILWLCYE